MQTKTVPKEIQYPNYMKSIFKLLRHMEHNNFTYCSDQLNDHCCIYHLCNVISCVL